MFFLSSAELQEAYFCRCLWIHSATAWSRSAIAAAKVRLHPRFLDYYYDYYYYHTHLLIYSETVKVEFI